MFISKFYFSTILKSHLPQRFISTFSQQNKNHTFQDSRFIMIPAGFNMNTFQIQHIQNVIDSLFKSINSNRNIPLTLNQFVDKRFLTFIHQFKQLLKLNQIDFNIARVEDKNIQHTAFLKIYGIQYPPQKYMHQLKFKKQGQNLFCHLRQLQKNVSLQESIKKQIQDKFKKSKQKQLLNQIRQQTQQKQVLKPLKEQAFKVMSIFFKTKQQKNKQKRKFSDIFKFGQQNHILIDKMQIPVNYRIAMKDKAVQQGQVIIQTKWLYKMLQNDAQSIKKNKKRVIFDLQDWSRGSFIPIKKFDQ